MTAVIFTEREPQLVIIASHDEPCADRFVLDMNLLYVWRKPREATYGVGEFGHDRPL